jgi:nitrous oxidase accessory protein NosD
MSIRQHLCLALVALTAVCGCSRRAELITQPRVYATGTTDPSPAAPAKDAASSPAAAANVVTLPAGSSNGLAAALVAAGPGGTVIVASGPHTESGTVTISQTVTLQGRPGAVILSTTSPVINFGDVLVPALHVRGASRVAIKGLELEPSGPFGGTAILVDDAADAIVSGNRIRRYQYSILLYDAARALVDGNVVESTTAWQTGQLPEALGIVAISGERIRITNNDTANGLFNIWACDRDGTLQGNRAHDGLIGYIMCKVPEGSWRLPGGEAIGAELSSTHWMARKNDASGNSDAGYLVIDGANNNMLVENTASSNGTYDLELAGDSYRFGFLTPASFQNTVRIGSAATMRVKNCGNDNSVFKGNQVDTDVDTCN